jgi:protein required for attachment to host cells
MRIAHEARVLVTDGRKMLFFRNEGDADYPNLKAEAVREQVNPPDRVQKSDAPGLSFSSFGGGRNTMEEVDFHEQAEATFAREAADYLRDAALRGEFESLIVVAPPKILGELRQHYHKEVSKRIVQELPKDLVKSPVPLIERILSRA